MMHCQARKYHFNENYFAAIDTPNKAYFLGFLFADGCISKDLLKVNLILQARDKHILESFSKDIEYSGDLFCRELNKKNPNHQDQYVLRLNSKKLVADLIGKGCTPAKSLTLKWPRHIPDYLVRHFIRGYFDGDGGINTFRNRNGNTKYRIKILGTLNICSSIAEFLVTQGKITKPRIYKYGNVFQMLCDGHKNAKLVYDYFYEGAELFLTRKKEKLFEVFGLPDLRIQFRPGKYNKKYPFVIFVASNGKWRATVRKNGKVIRTIQKDSEEEAHQARLALLSELKISGIY